MTTGPMKMDELQDALRKGYVPPENIQHPVWRPIETAPKDGTRILLLFPLSPEKHSVQCGDWEPQKYNTKPRPYWSGDLERIFGVGWYRAHQPTHWMPLPPPPSTTSKETES